MSEHTSIAAEIATPHVDRELGYSRDPLRYLIDLPSHGLNADTGLIFYIHGFGSRFDEPYEMKLGPFLADKYNCVVARVDYHGAVCHGRGRIMPSPDFFSELERIYGLKVTVSAEVPVTTIARSVLVALREKGITELDSAVQMTQAEQYDSFGLLPALDHLQVTHRLLGQYPINRRRLFALGTSYGGYIALMLNKFAPRTFRLVIDNSGFSSADDSPLSALGYSRGEFCGVRVAIRNQRHFKDSPAHPNYFTPAHASIRNLSESAHYAPSSTAIHSFHSAADTVASIERKYEVAAVLGEVRSFTLTEIGEADIDGRIFKTIAHGMQASMRGLFEIAYNAWLPTARDAEEITDFDLRSDIALPCADRLYRLRFDMEHGVQLTIGAL